MSQVVEVNHIHGQQTPSSKSLLMAATSRVMPRASLSLSRAFWPDRKPPKIAPSYRSSLPSPDFSSMKNKTLLVMV